MADNPTAYPLAWPIGRPRCRPNMRRVGEFGTVLRSRPPEPLNGARKAPKPKPVTLTEACERLATELDRLNGMGAILSTNVELRVDGRPRSGRPEPTDPGAAVYFRHNGKPVVLACDTYTQVAQNIAAIAAHIDSMRRQERYGVATMEQMFTGFLALPPPMVVDDWRAALDNPRTLSEAEARFRDRMKRAHPDAGGTHAQASALTAAIQRARVELRG